jgi:hypothetical protein
MNTPDTITTLSQSQIFVFGSNEHGRHAGGAARTAMDRFGAIWGQGEGHQGDSYAIPTMEGLPALAEAVSRFLTYAGAHPDLEFLVTRIGTGIAGHALADIAPLFIVRPPNVIIPLEFEAHLR